jgi:hypothetical protein
MLAVAVLVILAVLGGYLATRAIGGRTAVGGTGSSSPTASPVGPGAVPAGFTSYRHPGGFSVAVPQGWDTLVRPRGVVDVKDPDSARFLRLIRAGSAGDPRAMLAAAEPSFRRGHDGYRRIALDTVDYHGYPAADWEFRYDNAGATRRVLYRAFVVDGTGYAIYLSTPEEQWAASRRFFDTAAATFER